MRSLTRLGIPRSWLKQSSLSFPSVLPHLRMRIRSVLLCGLSVGIGAGPSCSVTLEAVDTASAGVLTNGEEWLFVEWVEERSIWRWDRRVVRLSDSRVSRSAEVLHEWLAPEFYSSAG